MMGDRVNHALRSGSRPNSQTSSGMRMHPPLPPPPQQQQQQRPLVTEARLSQLFDPIMRLVDEPQTALVNNDDFVHYRTSQGSRNRVSGSGRYSSEYVHHMAYPAIVESFAYSEEVEAASGVRGHSGGYLSPLPRDFRASLVSQTSSLHTALSELAGDVEVVDMEDGALNSSFTQDDYPESREHYRGSYEDQRNRTPTAGVADSGGDDFWKYVSCDGGRPVHLPDVDNYDEETYCPYVYSMEGEPINWQERCLQLEMSLQRFRDQAAKIRGLLRHKLAEMESRVAEAETRAEIAEEKVRLMEQQLSWSPTEATQELKSLQHSVVEKEKNISQLECQVDEQRKMRLNDARQVEAKAAKIKEWVTNKLRELEEQNQHLREQNQKCNEQLELLRNRLQQLSQNQATTARNNRTSAEDSSRGSLEGDQPGSDDSLGRLTSADGKSHCANNITSPADASAQLDALYAEIDPNKKRQRNSQTSGGLGLSGPVNSLMQQRFPENRMSLSGLSGISGTRSARDSRADSGSVDMGTPLSLSPKSPLGNLEGEVISESLDTASKKPIPPPRTRLPRKESDHSVSASASDSTSKSGSGGQLPSKTQCPSANTLSGLSDVEAESYDNLAASALGELGQAIDQAIASMTLAAQHSDYDVPKPPRSLKMRPKMVTNEVHDYAEIYTPSKERLPWGASRHPQQCNVGGSVSDDPDYHDDSKPPTPPLHRFPSWESRIYQAAAEGFVVNEPAVINSPSAPDAAQGRKLNRFSLAGYQDINIPVYATVKGRASQIRSVPFTGDSSDSSDGEDHPDTRDICNESNVSDDYALPPDANTSNELEPPVVATPSRLSAIELNDSLEKSGSLTKLGGKLKTWRKRWFVLRNGTLSYWKSQSDESRKPQGQIFLDDNCRVVRAEGAATFEISTPKKTYYLTADSSATVEDWVRILQNVLRRNTTRLLLGREDQKPTLQGWVTKVKQGHSKRCWGVLAGKTFLYFKTPNDQVPQGQISMRDARVEEVNQVSDSDSEENETVDPATGKSHFTVGVFPSHQDPTYLLLPTKQEKDAWLYNLTIVSGGGTHGGTQFEQLIQKLMETDGDPGCVLWRHPLLLHSKDCITSSLTTLPSDSLQNEAIKLFKAIQLFTSVLLDSAGIDYHVVLAQNALQQCLSCSELQPELLCALVKQTSRMPASTHGTGTSSKWGGSQKMSLTSTSSLTGGSLTGAAHSGYGGSDSKSGSSNFVFIQGWQLLALAVSLFAPRNNKILWYLRMHLRRNADAKTEVGKYAAYCQRALERTLQMGPREAKPSRMEVLSILLKNPYHHSLPHAIPVHFLNGTYQVVGFDGSTTIEEFLITLNQEIGCRDVSQSGFALFSDDPIEKELEHWIEPKVKLCDVISKWEIALREKGLGKFQNTKVIRLSYRHRLLWRGTLKGETERERLLHAYQTAHQITENRFPLTRELAVELAALMAQIDGGDYNAEKGRSSGGSSGTVHQGALQAVERFVPKRYRENANQDEIKQLADAVIEKWIALKGRTTSDCVRIYLTCVRKWPFYGASLFQAKVRSGGRNSELDGTDAWLAVNEEAITLLDTVTMQSSARIPYSSIVTFGGCQDDLMVVVNNCDIQGPGTQKMLFSLSKPKILELTLLIADYMNALGVLPNTPNTTLNRVDSRRSKRSKTKERDPEKQRLQQASVEPDILRATPEMEIKMQQLKEEAAKRRAANADHQQPQQQQS